MIKDAKYYHRQFTKTARQRKASLAKEVKRITSILKSMGAKKIILFGSLVRNQVRVASDVDIIVVLDTKKKFLDRLDEIYRRIAPSIAVDILVYTPSEFNKMKETNPFVMRALREGRILYESGFERRIA